MAEDVISQHHTVGIGHLRNKRLQQEATFKGFGADARNACGKGNGTQRNAIFKGTSAYALERLGDDDRGHGLTAIEHVVANALYALRNLSGEEFF